MAYEEDGVLLAEGFEEALIGKAYRFHDIVAVYDYEKCLNVLITRDGMDYDEAEDYMQYNVLGAYVGEQTPVFMFYE